MKHRFDWEYLTFSTNLSCCCPYVYTNAKHREAIETMINNNTAIFFFNLYLDFMLISGINYEPSINRVGTTLWTITSDWSHKSQSLCFKRRKTWRFIIQRVHESFPFKINFSYHAVILTYSFTMDLPSIRAGGVSELFRKPGSPFLFLYG
jgi:hypothetical protein